MSENKLNDLLKKSLQEVQQLRSALQRLQGRDSAPIAIVGMACRAPGGIHDPEAYWQLLRDGREAVGPLPERWRPAAIHDPDPDAPGKTPVRAAGTLADVEGFDAGFFRISRREADAMDPQQRLALECSWEALEHAGLRPGDLSRSRTGVYLGAMRSDYGEGEVPLAALDGYRGTGVGNGVLAGRVAYTLGFEGPALAVDTACSSSLVALHLACTALRQGECDLALAGGVTVMSTPALLVELSRMGASSLDGRCKAFGEQADGAGWAEGCGVLALKRLDDAERDGDRVLASIRGSAVNQDGRSQGLTVPNGPSQTRLLRAALERSGLGPGDIDAIEAHGTGTRLGDPIEVGALTEVFGGGRQGEGVWLGSSKSNLGHAQAAAGVLGLIKMVLALQHGQLPKTLHAEQPSREVDWPRTGLTLLQQAQPWSRRAGRVRRAGVSAFGIGGTNAHLIVEEAPAPAAVREPARDLVGFPLLLSARDGQALRAQAARWAGWLERHTEVEWDDVVRTAAQHRTHFAERASLAVRSREQAIEALQALAAGEADVRVHAGRARPRKGAVFVFSGQGGQWRGMGRQLLDESPEAAAVIRQCDAALAPLTGWSVEAALRAEPTAATPNLEAIDVVQPCLFAMALGLAAAWRALGVEPAAVVGHSQGEVAAAVVSGALSLEDGAKVMALRSRLLARLAGHGAMATVELTEPQVRTLLAEPCWAGLCVAVVNSRTSTVVAGEPDRLAAFVQAQQARDVSCRVLAVDYAAHTPQVDAIASELEESLAALEPRPGFVPFVSAARGQVHDGESLHAGYWRDNAREPVRFDRALLQLRAMGHETFVEVSPHPVLASALHEMAGPEAAVVASLRRDRGGVEPLRTALGALHVEGVPVDWAERLGPGGPPVELPCYAFQRERHWLALGEGSLVSASVRDAETHENASATPDSLRRLPLPERRRRLEALVVGALRTATGLARDAPIEGAVRPIDLGLDSVMALQLVRRLFATAGVDLRPSDVLSAGSVAALVERALAVVDGATSAVQTAQARTEPGSWLVPLRRPTAARTRLLCFAYSGAGPSVFVDWPSALPEDVEAWAVQLPGRGPRLAEEPAMDVAEVVEGVREALAQLPALPLLVFGHSLGAILAFELTRVLESQGEPVAHLVVSAAAPPALFRVPDPTQLSDTALLRAVDELGLAERAAMEAHPELTRLGLGQLRADLALAAAYVPATDVAPLRAALTALSGGRDGAAPFEVVEAWRSHSSSMGGFCHQHLAQAGHDFIHAERATVLRCVCDALQRAQTEACRQRDPCVREQSLPGMATGELSPWGKWL